MSNYLTKRFGTSDLLPCPFCGSADLYMVRLCIDTDTPFMSSEDATLAVFCNTCKVCVHVEEAENEGDNDETYGLTAVAWNRRPAYDGER